MIMWGSTIGGIVTLSLSLLTAPLTSQAQPAAHVPRLGLLIPSSFSAAASRIEAFRHGLRDLGYVEGQTILLEYRYADDHLDRPPALAAGWSSATLTSSLPSRHLECGPPSRRPRRSPSSGVRAILLSRASSPAWISRAETSPAQSSLAPNSGRNTWNCCRKRHRTL